jgi:hypothetical protein
MENDRPKYALRNRRFLVSLWYPVTQAGTDAATDANLGSLRGMVWEADPREPGRISATQEFSGIDALPDVLGRLLAQDGDSP